MCLLKQVRAITVLTLLCLSAGGSPQAAEITVDGEFCSLTDAINAANNDADEAGCQGSGTYDDDTIMLAVDVSLTTTLPEITSTVTINGLGHTIDGNNDVAVGTVMRITGGGNLTLNNTTVTGGITDLNILEEKRRGGGIYVDSSKVTLNNSVVSGNSGVPFNRGYYGWLMGGGFFAKSSTVVLNSSIVTENSAHEGGGFYVDSSTVTLNNSTVSKNWAYRYTGGILAVNNSTVTVRNSTISENEGYYEGGGILAGDSTITVTNSTISKNTTIGWTGGGICAADSILTLTDSTVSENRASVNGGGGIHAAGGTVTIANSTISGNKSLNEGGGILISNSTITITNSTVSENSALDDPGGGIFIVGGTVTVTNSTISENLSYFHGGGIFAASGIVTLNSSLLSGNTATGKGNEFYNDASCYGNGATVYSDNFNLLGHGGESYVEAFVGVTPGSSDINATSNGTNIPLASILSPLSDNGGPTKTHALPAGSPAIDLDTTCSPGTDQRASPRPYGAGCDAGAFERTQKQVKKIDRSLMLTRKIEFHKALENLIKEISVKIVGCAVSGQKGLDSGL